ncbi:hypothetical protein [Escherichia phage 1720a-02]|nr:hypothetical protein [Escherichia phage 1720a-02]
MHERYIAHTSAPLRRGFLVGKKKKARAGRRGRQGINNKT